MLSAKTRWGLCALAFFLPLVAAIVMDVEASSSASSGQNVVALFNLFIASAIVAAGGTAAAIMTAPLQLWRRFGLIVLVWFMLFLEVGGELLWLLRGLH